MRKIICEIAILAIIIVAGVHTYKDIKADRIQREIADNLIRFHVRANSDAEYDQELKILVKNAIVEYLGIELSEADSLEKARDILTKDTDNIREIAQQIVDSNGYDYPVDVYFERAYFPMKIYGDMSFPPGEYEAFRVDIGESCGRNWWCVLFPPLCFVDSTYSVVPDDTKADFRAILSEEAYDTITVKDIAHNNYEIRFKYLKFLNRFFE